MLSGDQGNSSKQGMWTHGTECSCTGKRGLEDDRERLALGLDAEERCRTSIASECKADPVVAVTTALLLYSLDIAGLLEHLGVLCHVLWVGERVKVSNVRLAVQDGNERCGDLAERAKRQGGEERKRLNLL